MYAVIEADGFFGDVATVSEVYRDKTKAIGSVTQDRRWQVIGGPDSEFSVGQKIHGRDIGPVYPHVAKTQ